jgi:hypothetical protein
MILFRRGFLSRVLCVGNTPESRADLFAVFLYNSFSPISKMAEQGTSFAPLESTIIVAQLFVLHGAVAQVGQCQVEWEGAAEKGAR